ncbi:ECF subfamily RNA polymerase sigma-24 subunit [Flavobacterium cauense R2A-7]|uniref:RNA polymerase sigma factor n=1 Tax=Flavobacterium cauense R2A-7 TaxID=1341154 RepID=V6S3C7_9FLAO|nr:RNA polymerase sigma factor [Flavobacterium cauense]ESU20929.1 ECF subfamily RNA polymerase sigma-24 subunit [Flavobacterium cauense R2A-7]TWI12274.1 RNA polymerase sigma-70 factor (ECF subfamily) [Flavobacterium cauense R2A-7]
MTTNQNQETFFKDIYQTYSPKVHRLCLGYTGNTMEADDLLQEVFIKAWQNLNKFRGDSQISTWIYRIAVNTCLHHLRSQKNKKNVDIDKTVIKKEEETDDKEQQIQLLYKCISELSEADRLIITLLLEEVPYSEIAEVTAISEGNLRVKIHRIKQQLSTIYAKYERI